MNNQRMLDRYALITIAVVVALFFLRLFIPAPRLIITPDFGESDAVFSYATKYFYANELKSGHLPLWDSQIGGGVPLYATGEMGTFYLPNLILFRFLPTIYAYNISIVLTLCIIGWGMYWWLRSLNYHPLPSLFGSITMALSGYSIVQLTHLTLIQSLSLFPLIAVLTHKLATSRQWKYAGWLTLVLAQQILIGFPQSTFITLLFIAAYWAWLLKSASHKFFTTTKLVVAGIMAMAIAAIQIVPSVEFLSNITTNQFLPDQATIFSYPFKHLLTLIDPYLLGNPATGTYPNYVVFNGSIFWENTAYIGIVPLLSILGFVAIRLWHGGKKIRRSSATSSIVFFLLILIASFLLMTGRNSPLYFIFSFWPFTIFRVPSRFIWLFIIALIVISVHSLHALFMTYIQKRITWLCAIFAIVIQILTIFLIWSPYHAIEQASEWLKPPSFIPYMLPGYTLTIGGELLYNNTYQLKGWSLSKANVDPSFILRNTLTPDKNMLWQVSQIKDYVGRTLRRSQVFNDLLDQTITTDDSYATISATGSKLLNMLAVDNVISTLSVQNTGLRQKVELTDPSHRILLFENSQAAASVYIATQTMKVTTINDAVNAIQEEAFVPGKTVLVENDRDVLSTSGDGAATIVASHEGEYSIKTRTTGEKSILVLTQTYYPGWHATIDGKEIEVFPVNIKHIGVLLPKGSHTVKIYYLPKSFLLGAWISVISLGITIFAMEFEYLLALTNNDRKAVGRASSRPHSHGRS